MAARRPRRAHGSRTRHPVDARAPEHRAALRCGRDGGRPAVPRTRVRRWPADRPVPARRKRSTCGPACGCSCRWCRPLPTRMAGWSSTAISSRPISSSPATVQIRLLDFGIAKLLDDENDRQSGLTELAGRPHTPEYASPEQISGRAAEYRRRTSTRSASCSTSSLAGSSARTRSAGAPAAPWRPQSSRPIRPRRARRRRRRRSARSCAAISTRLSSRRSGRSRPNATRRSTRLATTCTAGSRDARCSRAPTARDTALSKFVRRHAIAVTAAAVVVASLAAFGVVSARQARVLAEQRRLAQVERDTAEQVVRVLIDLFQTANPVGASGRRSHAGRRVSRRGAGAFARAAALDAGGACQAAAGVRPHPPDPRPVSWRPVGPSMPRSPSSSGSSAPIIRRRSSRCRHSPNWRRLLGENERARSAARGITPAAHPGLRRSTRAHGARPARARTVVAITDLDEGGRLLMRAVEIQRATLRPDDPVRAETLGSLAGYYTRRTEYERAKEAYREALAVFPTAQARRHPAAITHPERLRGPAQHAQSARRSRGHAARSDRGGPAGARRGHADGGEPDEQPRRDAEQPRTA